MRRELCLGQPRNRLAVMGELLGDAEVAESQSSVLELCSTSRPTLTGGDHVDQQQPCFLPSQPHDFGGLIKEGAILSLLRKVAQGRRLIMDDFGLSSSTGSGQLLTEGADRSKSVAG
jgi:hypothetical protein